MRSEVIFRVGAVDARLASLEDIVRSKTAAGRTKDELTLPVLIDRPHSNPGRTNPAESDPGIMTTL